MARRSRKTPSTSSSEPTAPAKLISDVSLSAAVAEVDPLLRHALDALQYAEQVHRGEILACVYVRLACKRHLDDLAKSKSKAYPYKFDLQKAGRVCAFLEMLPNIDEDGFPNIQLQAAQKFWVGSIFGWVRKDNGRRRFNRAYISIARKNGKTTLAAGIGLYMLACDGESSAQVYNGANSLKQACDILFDPVKAMVDARPELFGKLGVERRGEKRLFVPRSNARWRPISRKPGDGGGAHCFIQDEYHEAKTDILSETMVPGQIARKQPLDLKITTAGFTINGPCDRYEQMMKKLLEGSIERENTFAIIYTLDLKPYTDPFGREQPGDEWTSIAAAPKPNPLWGVSIDPEKFAQSITEALQDPAKQPLHKTKHCNIWCNAADAFYDSNKWNALAAKDKPLDYFLGRDCVVGLDLASKYDLCSMVLLFREEVDGVEHWYAFHRSYLPASVGNLPENTDYRTWRDGGWLTITSGNITDYGYILRDLLDAAAKFNIREVDFDQRESGFLLQEFEKVEGTVPLFEVKQSRMVLSEPMHWLKSLVIDGRIHHFADPLFSWSMGNVSGDYRSDGTVFPDHAGGNEALKIDPHSALLNAAVRAREFLSQPAAAEETGVIWI